jgi:hypothetical protein
MGISSLALRRLALVLIVGSCLSTILSAQAETGRARVALFEPVGQKADTILAAVLSTVADSVELSLACLQVYDVRRLASADPSRQLEVIRAYCAENRIDQAICGSGSARAGGGYLFRLQVYDRRTDSISLSREGVSKGALDMFDVTDTLVASLLDGLSGTHLLFGSLSVQTEPPGAIVSVNGKDVGPSPVALRGLPVGAVRIAARSDGREEAATQVTIADGETADAALTLARSKGKLAVEIPDDAELRVVSGEIGAKVVSGSSAQELPTGKYEVVARCPGLDPVQKTITIKRNEMEAWTPWPNAYLAVQSNPPGAVVLVDGAERGSTPAMIELEPGKKHLVALKLAKYQDWTVQPEFPAARKQSLHADLSLLPGSIEVTTSLPGASIEFDKKDSGRTPHLFEAVPAGMHTILISDLLRDRRYYTTDGAVTVEVKPGERSVLSVPLKPGKATLTLAGAPKGSVVTVDGERIDVEKASAEGVEIPAGALNIEAIAPSQQKWKGYWVVQSGGARIFDCTKATACLPYRTITIDGKTDDWIDVLPVLSPQSQSDMFPNQAGTQIAQVFACRDEKNLYFRVDFSDGTPTAKISKDIDAQLKYVLRVRGKESNLVTVEIGFDRKNGQWTTLGVWNDVTHTWKTLATPLFQNLSYRIGNGTLEIGVPFAPYTSYVSDGAYPLEFYVISADSDGQWGITTTGGTRTISFVP